MSDQQPNPDETQDTSVNTDAPAGDVTEQTDGTNWQERYEHLQPEFTRATQEAAQYRQLVEALTSEDQDTRAYAAQALGLELAPPQNTDDGFEDPNADLRRKIEEFDQWRQATMSQAQQAQAQERDVAVIGGGIGRLQEQLGRELTEQEVQLIGDAAWANRDDKGLPNIDQVIELYTGIRTHDQKTWAKTKNAPFVSSSGQAATQAPNLDDDQQRQQWMAQQLADLDT
jgi:hypothetical protein